MLVIPAIITLAFASPALSAPLPRGLKTLFARQEVLPPVAPVATEAINAVPTDVLPTATGTELLPLPTNQFVAQASTTLGADPAEESRIINDLFTFSQVNQQLSTDIP